MRITGTLTTKTLSIIFVFFTAPEISFLVNHNRGTLTYNNKYSLDVALNSHDKQYMYFFP